jgi:hypothetical protein
VGRHCGIGQGHVWVGSVNDVVGVGELEGL